MKISPSVYFSLRAGWHLEPVAVAEPGACPRPCPRPFPCPCPHPCPHPHPCPFPCPCPHPCSCPFPCPIPCLIPCPSPCPCPCPPGAQSGPHHVGPDHGASFPVHPVPHVPWFSTAFLVPFPSHRPPSPPHWLLSLFLCIFADPDYNPVPQGDPQRRADRELRRGTRPQRVALVAREAPEREAGTVMQLSEPAKA